MQPRRWDIHEITEYAGQPGFDYLVETFGPSVQSARDRRVLWQIDQSARTLVVTSHPVGCLNILRVRLGLPKHEHESQPQYIQTDRNHVGDDGAIDPAALAAAYL